MSLTSQSYLPMIIIVCKRKKTEMLNLEVIFLTYLLVLDEGFDSIQVVPDLLVESIRNEFASIELI